jgi:hypothetical protein
VINKPQGTEGGERGNPIWCPIILSTLKGRVHYSFSSLVFYDARRRTRQRVQRNKYHLSTIFLQPSFRETERPASHSGTLFIQPSLRETERPASHSGTLFIQPSLRETERPASPRALPEGCRTVLESTSLTPALRHVQIPDLPGSGCTSEPKYSAASGSRTVEARTEAAASTRNPPMSAQVWCAR